MDILTDHTVQIWLAAFASGFTSWFMRGVGIGREWGRIETELKNLSRKFDTLETRINQRFDRED